MQPRIWDTIIFGTEADLDMLECRLTQLDPYVHRFVISESRLDPRGKAKPMWLREHWERYAAWHDRIVHVDATGLMSQVPPLPGLGGTYWLFEDAQREAIGPALSDADPDDVIGHGDVDEIPKPSAFGLPMDPGWVLGAQHHAYALDWLCDDGWRSYTMLRASEAPKSVLKCRHAMTPLAEAGRTAEDAMWHLSWFGGIPAQMAKFDTTVHADIPDEVRGQAASGKLVREGWHWQGHWRKLKFYRGDDLPEYVKAGREPAWWWKAGQLTVSAGGSGSSAPGSASV